MSITLLRISFKGYDKRITQEDQYCQGIITAILKGMEIRLRVKEIAMQKGFNQSSLSRSANVDFKTVKRIFQDPTRDVSLSTVVKIAWALDVPLADILEIHGEPHDRPEDLVE